MSFFSSSILDHWRISVIIITFANVCSFTNIRFIFLFIEMTSLKSFSQDVHNGEYLITDEHPMAFLSPWRSHHGRISVMMNTFGNLWSFTNNQCLIYLIGDKFIEEFLLVSTHSAMFAGLPTSDLFVTSSRYHHWKIFVKISRFRNVSSLTNIRCPFSLHRDEVIEEILLRWKYSEMFIH